MLEVALRMTLLKAGLEEVGLESVQTYINSRNVLSMCESNPSVDAKKKYLICKRWDQLTEEQTPQFITFFATADIISALHMLAYYDYPTIDGVISPWGGGCEAMIFHHDMVRKGSL